ncbi:ATP-binding protein [Kribbella alba]|uniref:ATP-binding protein n=1 Tax=Kribbella alba TaxID=190197 RepID=UPI0031D1FB9C
MQRLPLGAVTTARRPCATAERLAEHAVRLARTTEALEDHAALVAHEVKSSLLSALHSDDLRLGVNHAIELVDSILEAVHAEGDPGHSTALTVDCVRQAVADSRHRIEVIMGPVDDLPIPAGVLRLVLRNLVANAAAAGARRLHVWSRVQRDRSILVVEDDGVGPGASRGYATGTRLGLTLCRRLVARFDGVIELEPRTVGGARAMVSIGRSG